MQAVTYKDLSHYLLLLDNNEESKLRMVSLPSFSGTVPSDHANQLQSRVLDFCISEVDKAKQRWKESLHQNPQGVTPDMLRVLTNLCVAAASIATMTDGERNDHRVSTLKSAADELAQSFVKLVSKSQTEQYKVDAILASCAQILPDIRRIPHLRREIFQKEGLMFISTHLSRALEERLDAKQSFHAEEDDFMMDIDDGPTSQMTAGASGSDVEVPRHDIQASAESGALHVCCSTFLRLISSVGDMTEDEQDYIPSEFVEYLATMSEADLLRSRQLVQSLLGSRFKISRTDCLKLLERLSDALIDPKAREYNTSEVANGMVVDVLIGTTRVWTVDTTDREAQDLYENVEALYAYYAKGLEKSGVRRSPGLQMRVAKFFHGLLRHHPGFGQNRKVPSVRTSLFELLSQGEMTVKYHIAERLPGIFEDFVLSEHDKILEDVDSSLPSEDDWFEGIAVRLLVLANLASRWHTLLRQCVYRLFATAGSIKGVAQHARRCISQVAESRNMADSQSLFRLFAPQIVYTWLDRERKLAEMPYSTFGYETLEDFLRDMESEGVGQAIMRGLQDEVNYLAVQLGISVTDLLIRNMSKAAAYTISWDTCRGYGRNKSMPSTCSLLRDLVGKDQYHQLIYAHFSEVLGHILQTIDQEDKFSKQLSKRPAFASTEKALSEMEGISRSMLDLNIGIEPAFSAYYLFDQIDRLCRRADADTLRFWEPSTYTMVIRMLLDRMHPALGSLYARSLIRKIRIVVALAGPVAYEGYPLQMTLQSLRPFLTDVQCAEDTVGIMQYLFSHGTPFLTSDLNFVTGIGLSVLISIRVFLGSSQESTTQQSQHTATMNTATRFHKWFTNYLTTYADGLSVNESQSSIKAFKLITMAASQVRTEGNSMRGSEESKLLLEILDDVRSGRRLLNNTSREVALDLLCQNFQPAPTARDDVLGSDDQASEFASQVWESCQRNNVGNGYLLWAARVLGRAFGARGYVTRNTANLNPWSAQMLGIEDRPGRASRSAIVKEVVDLFYSDDRGEVSLAENAIRLVIANLPNASGSYAAEMGAIIPEHVGRALGSSISSEESSSLQGRPTIQQCAALTDSKPMVDWIRDLAISLCREAYQDPVLGALPTLLAGINHMAEKLFPFILHLVLLREFDGTRTVHQVMSTATMTWFSKRCSTRVPYMRILVQSILYLRSQPVPKEVTRVDRERWLELDYLTASEAATECGMYRSALLFAETSSGQPKVKSVSRRSSVMSEPPKLPVDLQLSIYKNLDEPDSFYGVDRGFGLASVIDRLDYEGDGVKSLLFRGARLDSQFRRTNALEPADSRGVVKSLIALNMNSVTHSLLSNDQFREMGSEVVENTLRTARKLGQWDMKAPDTNHTEASTLFKAFQGLHYATSITAAKESLDSQFLATMGFLSGKSDSPISNKTRLRTLATLTEADDVISVGHPSHLLDTWDGLKGRESWMRAGE
jgi:ataxia telangiectasia mutated family protein